ncbi:MAG: TonB-dependent receptor [Lentimicrobium sp.]|nr:TonB-dependent receptor [Lentimicrobium sp.]
MKRTALLLLIMFTSLMHIFGQQKADTVIKLPLVTITDSLILYMTPRSTIAGDLFEKTNVADVGEVLRGEPNISGIRRGGYAIDPVVRGFRYSQLNIFLDEGIHIEGGCPNRMDPVLSHVEPELIKRIEIVRGPYLLQYGPSPATSIRIITRQENPFANSKPQLISITGYDANRNGFRQHLSVSGSGKKIYYQLGGGLKDYGNYTDGNGKEWESSFKKKDLSADLGFLIDKDEVLTLSYKGAFGRDVMFPALAMDEIADNTHIFSAVYIKHNPLDRAENLQISAYHTNVYHEMDNRFRPQYSTVVPPYTGLMQAVAKVNTSTNGVRVIKYQKVGRYLVNGGLDSELAQKDGTRHMQMIMQMDGQEFISEKSFNLWKDAFILNSGLFAGFQSENRKFNYAATFRTDLNYSDSGDTLEIIRDGITYFKVSPVSKVLFSISANGSWAINEKASLSIGLARGTRAPDLQERYIKFLATGNDKYDYLGNPELMPEVNYQVDLMFDYKLKSASVFVNLFRSDVQNYITGTLIAPSIVRPVSMGAPGVKQFNNINRAVLYGFEAGLTAALTEFFGIAFSSGYTYAYFPSIEKIVLENGQATGTIELKNDPIAEIPAFEAMMKASYVFLNGKLTPGFSLRAVAAQKQVSEASYEKSTPGYVLADISIDYKPCAFATFTAGVNNLLDKAYYDHLNRKLAGSDGKLFEPGRTLYINLKIKI